MSKKKHTKGTLDIIKSWFGNESPFAFTIEDYADNDLQTNTRILYEEYQPKLNKMQEARKFILNYIRSNNKVSITRKEIVDISTFSESSIKDALKELVDDAFLIEEGQTKNKIFRINTEIFKPNEVVTSVG